MDLRKLITNQTHVALKLACHVASTVSSTKNSVFSPSSLYTALSLLAAGSSGSTRDELVSVLGSDSIDDLNKLSSEIISFVFANGSDWGGPKLNFANGVLVARTLPFKPGFKRVVEDLYRAGTAKVDFANEADKITSELNSWAETQTNGLIKDIVPRGFITGLTKLVIANALYFKGKWGLKFNKSDTNPFDFQLFNGRSVNVPFMTSHRSQFIKTSEHCKVLRLAYKQGEDRNRQFSMYVFLPHERDGLPSLMQKFSSDPENLIEHLKVNSKVNVGQFRVPKFKIELGFEASGVLKRLGVQKVFGMGGLTEMVDSSISDELYVSSIIHKSFIEVDEEGTEAAVVTVVGAVFGACIPTFTDFVADHPFMFMIREDVSGVVLFMGHVIDPSS